MLSYLVCALGVVMYSWKVQRAEIRNMEEYIRETEHMSLEEWTEKQKGK